MNGRTRLPPAGGGPGPPPRTVVERVEIPAPGRGRFPPPSAPRTATRGQRLGLIFGVLGALLFAIWLFEDILTPFVLAAVIAYFLDPPCRHLVRLGLTRSLAAGLLITALAALALVVVLVLYPLIVSQIGLLIARLPAYATGIAEVLRQAVAELEEALGPEAVDVRLRDLAATQVSNIVSFLGAAATRLIGGGFALFSVFTLVVVTPIVAFYMLRDWQRMLARLEALLPRRSAATLRQLARDTDRVLSAWLRGQLLCSALLAAYYAVGLTAVGLELGLTVGLLAGVLTFIPYVGSLTGFILALLLALGQFGTWREVLMVAVVFVSGQIVEGYIIYPRLLGARVELHAVWVIFALFAGGVVLGFLGVLLAVPIAAALGVVTRYWLRRYLESPLYLDPPRTGT